MMHCAPSKANIGVVRHMLIASHIVRIRFPGALGGAWLIQSGEVPVGSGSTSIAANFTCVTDEDDFNQMPAPRP